MLTSPRHPPAVHPRLVCVHTCSAYKGSQLLDMVPAPPNRVMKIFRHTTPEFVEGRRVQLQEFVGKLLRVRRCGGRAWALPVCG